MEKVTKPINKTKTMSLTEKQIKNLKEGDPVIIHGTFIKESIDGDIVCRVKKWVGGIDDFGTVADSSVYARPRYVSLPTEKPKYDPARLFKKGDIVRLKDWNGRCPAMYSGTNSWFDHPPRCRNGNLEVREDEKSSKVEIGIIGVNYAYAYVAPCYLELITPIEELKPYSVEERTEFSGDVQYGIIHIYYNYDGGRDKVRTFYENGPESWNATKAAAEAECDRLNAEWRKEHNNEHT